MKYYTGVGSRSTPVDIQRKMSKIASELDKLGFILRSGGAMGADQAFEHGVLLNIRKEIYYAYHYYKNDIKYLYDFSRLQETREIVKLTHPTWNYLSEYAKALHTRNYFQVNGVNGSQLSQFLICYTPDGCESVKTRHVSTGGTATAIVIAEMLEIPVYNLCNEERIKDVEELILKLKEEQANG